MGSQYSQEEEKPKENLKELFDLRKKKIRNASPFIERRLSYNPIEKKVSKEETKLTLKELNLDKKFVEKYYNEEITRKIIKPDFSIEQIIKSTFYLSRNKLNNNNINNNQEKNNNKRFSINNNPNLNYEFRFFRNEKELRNSFYTKLISKNLGKINKSKNYNSIFIFDWDDTLFFTSVLTPNGYYQEKNIKLGRRDYDKISSIEYSVKEILTFALKKGNVFIITNSHKKWVEISIEKYYPLIKPLMDKIIIISARENYEKLYPSNSKMWKFLTYYNIKNHFDCTLLTNIICVGDNENDLEAGISLGKCFNKSYVKTVKLRENPNLEELNKQLILVNSQLLKIYLFVKDINIKVQSKKREIIDF
jgi:hypothetical protein